MATRESGVHEIIEQAAGTIASRRKSPSGEQKASRMRAGSFLYLSIHAACFYLFCQAGLSAPKVDARPHSVAKMFDNAKIFRDAIALEKPHAKPDVQLTGITVPHHLLAVDLIARGFWAASNTKVKRVLLLSPDHFRRSKLPFATTTRSFQTIFGSINNEVKEVRRLLQMTDLFEESLLFEREHGIGAVTPFIAKFFPNAKIVPIAISVDSTAADWERAAKALTPLVGEGTLVVQSTDFSHYLSLLSAQQRDQETMNIIGSGDLEWLRRLRQSDHLDSKAAQYIQAKLQASIGAVGPIVVANRNSAEYGSSKDKTTSYTVQLYGKNIRTDRLPRYSDQQVTYFGGDVLFGRYLSPYLSQPRIRDELISVIIQATGGFPLVINLEGALLDDVPLGWSAYQHIGRLDLAIDVVKKANIVAASLANNHAFDLGEVGLAETESALAGLGVKAIRQGGVLDINGIRILAMNFISKRQIERFPITTNESLDRLCRESITPPLVAFVHWGEEYVDVPSENESHIAERLGDCGVNAVIGAHSHRASKTMQPSRDASQQVAFSLGNLLFDQGSDRASGVLLEVRRFRQGSFATRLVPLPNLFDLARSLSPSGISVDTNLGRRTGN